MHKDHPWTRLLQEVATPNYNASKILDFSSKSIINNIGYFLTYKDKHSSIFIEIKNAYWLISVYQQVCKHIFHA